MAPTTPLASLKWFVLVSCLASSVALADTKPGVPSSGPPNLSVSYAEKVEGLWASERAKMAKLIAHFQAMFRF